MSESHGATSSAIKPKKSVALSGVTAGNTALCTVGRTGNDLHYRGYDIHDLATKSSFEETAHLLVHGTLHAQGHDHEQARQAKAMEALESAILLALGLPDPWARGAQPQRAAAQRPRSSRAASSAK